MGTASSEFKIEPKSLETGGPQRGPAGANIEPAAVMSWRSSGSS